MRPVNLDELIARNPKVDLERLREYQRQAALFEDGLRCKYNIVSPFAGRMHRHQMAECGGPSDNVRKAR